MSGPCANGHVFAFTGTVSDNRCPEATPCACGKTLAHWEVCPCGQAILKAVRADARTWNPEETEGKEART